MFREEYWEVQRQIMESVRDNRRTTVRAGHAPGKTFVAARIALWSLYCWPGSLVITTAPTWRQVRDLLFTEMRSAHAKARVPLGGTIRPSLCQLSLADVGMGQQWGAFGLSTNEGERFQGYHSYRILIIVDEASGVRDEIFEAINGISASGDVRLLLIGNPTKPFGYFYDSFHRLAGLFRRIHVSVWDTPNLRHLRAEYDSLPTLQQRCAMLRAAPSVKPYLVSAHALADMLEGWGEDSDVTRVRMFGEFPRGASDQLIPLWMVEAAEQRWLNYFDGRLPTGRRRKWWEERHLFGGRPIGALDPARFGDSESVFGAHLDHVVAPMQSWQGLDTVELAGRIPEHFHRLQLSELVVDDVGVGGGPHDMLARVLPGVRGFNGASPANDSRHFLNCRAEGYCGVRDLLRDGKLMLPSIPELNRGLTSIRYGFMPNGQLRVLTKNEMKKLGFPSPDYADTLMMMTHGGGRVVDLPEQPQGSQIDWSRFYAS